MKKAFDYHAKKNLFDAISMSRVTYPVFSNFTLILDTMEMFPYHGQMHLGQYFGLYTSDMKLFLDFCIKNMTSDGQLYQKQKKIVKFPRLSIMSSDYCTDPFLLFTVPPVFFGLSAFLSMFIAVDCSCFFCIFQTKAYCLMASVLPKHNSIKV